MPVTNCLKPVLSFLIELSRHLGQIPASTMANLVLLALNVGLVWYGMRKHFLEPANIKLHVGDFIDAIKSEAGQQNRLHIRCAFRNVGAKGTTITRMACLLELKDNKVLLGWNEFFDYKGGYIAGAISPPRPIGVAGRGIEIQGIQFRSNETFALEEGVWNLAIYVWTDDERKPKCRINESIRVRRSDHEELLGPPMSRTPGVVENIVQLPLEGRQVTIQDLN